MKDSKVKHNLDQTNRFKISLLIEGLVVGLLAGIISIIYRILLQNAESICDYIICFIDDNIFYIIGWFIFLLLLGLIIGQFIKRQPYISGSGIPQVEAEVIGLIDQPWYQVLGYKIVAGTLSIIGGLSLGREGPSIQLGALVGKGFSRLFHRIKVEERYLLTCGAAAGLSAAFNAPLAGTMFALEEIHKNFSTSAIVSVMCASLTGDFISKNVFGLSPVFDFKVISTLSLNNYQWIILLGVITGLAGIFYNYFVGFIQNLYQKITFIKDYNKVIIPLLISGILALTLPQVLGGGHKIITILEANNGTLSFLVILLLIKFLFSIISFGSGAPGGIFFPLLVLGCLIGAIYGNVVINYFGVNAMYCNNFVILAMAGIFAGIVRAPLTGIILIAEMSGTLTQLLPIALISFVAYIVANGFNSTPIYESLLHRLLCKENKKIHPRIEEKELISYLVELGSFVESKSIQDISWPEKSLIVSVKRGEGEIIPRGDTKLYVGDLVIIMIDNNEVHKDELELLFNV